MRLEVIGERCSRQQPHEMRIGPEGAIRILRWDAERRPEQGAVPMGSILLLHGMGDSADIWRPVLRHWPRPFATTIIALDLPGHGRSHEMAPGNYCEGLVARRIASALHEIGVMRPILIGHSRGARIALRLLREGFEAPHVGLLEMGIIDRHPHHAAVAAHIREMAHAIPAKEELIKRCVEKLPLADRDALSEFIDAQAVRHHDGWRLPTDIAALALLDEATAPDALASLRQLSSPLTVLRGAFSALLSRQDLTRIVQATLAPVTTHEIARAGHALLIEQPRSVAAILAQAVNGVMA